MPPSGRPLQVTADGIILIRWLEQRLLPAEEAERVPVAERDAVQGEELDQGQVAERLLAHRQLVERRQEPPQLAEVVAAVEVVVAAERLQLRQLRRISSAPSRTCFMSPT